jgi:serine/threonine protein kinase
LKPSEILRYLIARGFVSAAEAELVTSRWSAERDGPLLQYLGAQKIVPKEVAEDLVTLIGNNQLDGLQPQLQGLILLSVVGKGGRGTVYRAWQTSLKRIVAVKVLSDALSDNREYIQRFLREARVASKVQHRNIVRAFDINRKGNTTYMVMEYVPGVSLGAILRSRPKLGLAEALETGRAVADALGYVSKVGLVHRDIKPDNIMIDRRGRVKLCDLGLARPTGGTNITAPMMAQGTPAYMAPEAALRAEIDAQADVYSLGVTLYRALLGRVPFENHEPVEILRMHIEEQPRGLDGGEMPGVVAELLRRMLEKEPTRRPPAKDLAREFVVLQKSLPGMDRHKLWELVPGGEQGLPEPEEPLTLADDSEPAPANSPAPRPVVEPAGVPRPVPAAKRRTTGVGVATLGFALFVSIVYILFMTLSGNELPDDPRVTRLESRVSELENDLATERAQRLALAAQLRESAERLKQEEALDARRRAANPPRQNPSEVVKEITDMRETGRLSGLPGAD